MHLLCIESRVIDIYNQYNIVEFCYSRILAWLVDLLIDRALAILA